MESAVFVQFDLVGGGEAWFRADYIMGASDVTTAECPQALLFLDAQVGRGFVYVAHSATDAVGRLRDAVVALEEP